MNECVTGLIVAVEFLFDRIPVSKFYDKLRNFKNTIMKNIFNMKHQWFLDSENAWSKD